MQAVRSELSDRLSSTGRGYHSREDLGELPLTMAIWKEALRLHPVAIGVMRETGEVRRNPLRILTANQIRVGHGTAREGVAPVPRVCCVWPRRACGPSLSERSV